MKRLIAIAAPLFLVACGESSHLRVELTNDDHAAALLAGALPRHEGDVHGPLDAVKEVKVTVTDVSAHLAGSGGPDEVEGDQVGHDGAGWRVLSADEQVIDLVALRDQVPQLVGEIELPPGKITQVRLKLKTDADDEPGKRRITDAILEADGVTRCDLRVPASASDPGLKLAGVFKAVRLRDGGKHTAVVNLRLSESTKLAVTGKCTYDLNPVLQIKSAK